MLSFTVAFQGLKTIAWWNRQLWQRYRRLYSLQLLSYDSLKATVSATSTSIEDVCSIIVCKATDHAS